MSRKLERTCARVLGIWQIIQGVITIWLYGSYIQGVGAKDSGVLSYKTAQLLNAVFGSMHTFVVSFGVILIGLGLFNLYLAKYTLKDSTVIYKTPIYLICTALVAYMCMDIISVLFAIIAGIVALSKNKSLKQVQS